MPNSQLQDTLNELATAKTGRSQAKRLREVFPEVERALTAGVSRQRVLEALQQDGITMTMASFEKALYRIRKKAKSQDGTPGPQTAAPKQASTTAFNPKQTPAEKPKALTHSELRKIRDEVNGIDLNALVSGQGIVQSDKQC